MDAKCLALEIVRLSPGWEKGLQSFLLALTGSEGTRFFYPHQLDEKTIRQLTHYAGEDLYYLLVEGDNVLGYGLLRGWDEGYQIPSLGIAVHPLARGYGLGKLLMEFLHVAAFRKGASKVRLRVHKENENALNMYKGYDYVFVEDNNKPELLVGHKTLSY